MAETIREVVVTIEVDTNKQTHRERITLEEGETIEELKARVATALTYLTEDTLPRPGSVYPTRSGDRTAIVAW